MIRSALTPTKPTIPLPASIPVKLSINICAQTKVNADMLCFTNICLMKVPCQGTIRPHHKRRGCSLTSPCQDPKSSTFPQISVYGAGNALWTDAERKEKQGKKENNICQVSVSMCIVSLSFHNDCLIYLLLSPFIAEKLKLTKFKKPRPSFLQLVNKSEARSICPIQILWTFCFTALEGDHFNLPPHFFLCRRIFSIELTLWRKTWTLNGSQQLS